MKNLLDYIYNEPFRVLSLLGINLDAFQFLTVQVEKAQNTHQNEQEAEKIRINAKGAGRPPKLSLEESIALCLFIATASRSYSRRDRRGTGSDSGY